MELRAGAGRGAAAVGGPAALAQASFSVPSDLPASEPSDVAMADLDRDGIGDLVTANRAAGDIEFFPGDGFGLPGPWLVGDEPESIAMADVNGDDDLDLVTANAFSHDASVLLGDGDGGFAAPASIALSGAPFSVAAGDVNGDGKPDLAVARSGSDGPLRAARHRHGRLRSGDEHPHRPRPGGRHDG